MSFVQWKSNVIGAEEKRPIPIGTQLASKRIDREKIEETFGRPGLAYPANEIGVALWALWLHQTIKLTAALPDKGSSLVRCKRANHTMEGFGRSRSVQWTLESNASA